ncbi:MAG TPA: hypothetical protein DCK93_16615, partial [Blastocatellia bacterium]|nr:hypothetical protein [Blastocatellia bacterium]
GRYAADATPMLSERGAEKNNKTSAHGTTTYSASTDAWDGVIVKKELPGFSNAVQGTFEDLQRDP